MKEYVIASFLPVVSPGVNPLTVNVARAVATPPVLAIPVVSPAVYPDTDSVESAVATEDPVESAIAVLWIAVKDELCDSVDSMENTIPLESAAGSLYMVIV